MKNKFGRSAMLAGIATILVIVLGSALNSLIFQMLDPDMMADIGLYISLALNAAEAVIAFFLAIKYGSKLLLKKDLSASKILPLSIAAGVVKSLAIFYIQTLGYPIIALVNYILTFAVFFVFSLIMDKSIESADSINDPSPVPQSAPQKPKVIANEAMSVKAQYAFNQKLAELMATATLIDDTIEAKLFAQAVELQLLKAPATAQFCPLEEMTVTSAGDVYAVSGYVDSQNSYGAMVRTPFKITVFKENGSWKNADKFVDTSVAIQGKVMSNTLAWWILGIVGSIITFLFYYFFISSQIGF